MSPEVDIKTLAGFDRVYKERSRTASDR